MTRYFQKLTKMEINKIAIMESFIANIHFYSKYKTFQKFNQKRTTVRFKHENVLVLVNQNGFSLTCRITVKSYVRT